MARREFLERLRDWVRSSSNTASVCIKGAWNIDCIYQPTEVERKFVYQIIVAQTLAQGACYYSGPPIAPDSLVPLVGSPYSFAPHASIPVDIALLDSVANSIPQDPYVELYLSGESTKKAAERARLVASEVNRLACSLTRSRRVKVCNVGVVSLLVGELIRGGFEVTATDMDSEIIGRRLFDSTIVASGSETLGYVAECDIAVVTGMTLSNDTLPGILRTAREADTLIVMFCETASGCAPFLIGEGAACVVSEPFPFYIFDGLTHIRVHRASYL